MGCVDSSGICFPCLETTIDFTRWVSTSSLICITKVSVRAAITMPPMGRRSVVLVDAQERLRAVPDQQHGHALAVANVAAVAAGAQGPGDSWLAAKRGIRRLANGCGRSRERQKTKQHRNSPKHLHALAPLFFACCRFFITHIIPSFSGLRWFRPSYFEGDIFAASRGVGFVSRMRT